MRAADSSADIRLGDEAEGLLVGKYEEHVNIKDRTIRLIELATSLLDTFDIVNHLETVAPDILGSNDESLFTSITYNYFGKAYISSLLPSIPYHKYEVCKAETSPSSRSASNTKQRNDSSILSQAIDCQFSHAIWRLGPIPLPFDPAKEVNKNMRKASKNEIALMKLGKTKIITSSLDTAVKEVQGRKRIFSVDFGAEEYSRDLIEKKAQTIVMENIPLDSDTHKIDGNKLRATIAKVKLPLDNVYSASPY